MKTKMMKTCKRFKRIRVYRLMVSYEKNKIHIYNYQAKHKEQIRERNKIRQREYRTKDYIFKKISLIFLRILISE